MKKRIFATLLTLALFVFFTPITAYAATEKEKEPNDTALTATEMKSGVTYKGTICDKPNGLRNYKDFYKFKVKRPSMVYIYIEDYNRLVERKCEMDLYDASKDFCKYFLIHESKIEDLYKGTKEGEYYRKYYIEKANTYYLEFESFAYSAVDYAIRVEIKEIPDVLYRTQVQKQGWQDWKKNGDLSGTTSDLRLEAIKIKLENTSVTGDIKYHTYIQKIGWEKTWAKNGSMSGTQGQKLRLEAIQIKLTGNISKVVDVYYRTYVEKLGWLGWGKNGTSAGTAGYAYKLEGIEISVVPKGTRPNRYNSKSAFVKKQ